VGAARRWPRVGPPSRWLLDGAAGGDDLLLRGARDLVDRDVQLNRNLACAENLDLFVLANGALGDQITDGDVAPLGVELGEAIQVHDLVFDPERVLESAELGSAHDLVQVAALEPDAHLVAGLGALGAAARGLALGALTASDAGLGLLRTLSGAEVVGLEHLRARCDVSRLLGGRLLRRGLGRGLGGVGLALGSSSLRGSRLGGGLLSSGLLLSSRLVGSSLRSGRLGGGLFGSGLLLC